MLDRSKGKIQNILVCGTLFSGSSAVIELLSEMSNIGKIPGEFDDFRRIGLIGDILEKRISNHYPSYVDSYILNRGRYVYVPPMSPTITSNSIGLRLRLFRFLSAIPRLRNLRQYIKDKKRWGYLEEVNALCSNSAENEKNIYFAKKWISKLNTLYCSGKKYCLYDQPIFLSRHKDIWPLIFDPYKLIVVVRNPKDQLAQLIKLAGIYSDHTTNINQGLWEIFGFNLADAIRFQAMALSGRLRALIQLQADVPDRNLKIIAFEKLVRNYDHEVKELINFIGDGCGEITHDFPRKIFNPEISEKNIGIYENFEDLFSGVDLSEVLGLYKSLRVE